MSGDLVESSPSSQEASLNEEEIDFVSTKRKVKSINCQFHVKKNLRKHAIALGVKNEELMEVLSDFDKLQICSNKTDFEIGSKLFIKKWVTIRPKLADYCHEEIFNSPSKPNNPMATWYEGYAWKTPSTNNALEAFNKVYKDNYTFRERMKVAEFCEVLISSIESISTEKKRGEKPFMVLSTISLKQWTAAYNFKRLKKTLRSIGSRNGFSTWIIPAGDALVFDEKRLKSFYGRNWKTFKAFSENINDFYIVKIHEDANPCNDLWRENDCSCAAFAKQYICKHVIGLCLRKNLMDVTQMPVAAKSVPLGEKRKPGRPALAKPALVVQDRRKKIGQKTRSKSHPLKSFH